MKKRFRPLPLKSIFRFNRIVFLAILFISNLSLIGQTTKVFTKEIEVTEDVTVESNLPSSFGLKMNGTITTNNTKDHYALHGRSNEIRVNIIKDLNIETWERNFVKQETRITVRTGSEVEDSALLEEFKLDLKVGADKRIVVDCNLNMDAFHMKNHIFMDDDCYVKLSNGKRISINFIEIETKLYIPKSTNLSVKGNNYAIIRLGELLGDLRLDLEYTEVYGTKLTRLFANLENCYNVIFQEVASANISAVNSFIKIENIGELTIGESGLVKNGTTSAFTPSKANSALTKYKVGTVGLLMVMNSDNDSFYANEVEYMDVKKTNYTKFDIGRLNVTAIISAKNCDFNFALVAKDFTNIEVENSLCDLHLHMEDSTGYQLQLNRNEYIEFTNRDSSLQLLSNDDNIELYKKGTDNQKGKINITCSRCKLLLDGEHL